MLPLKMKAGEQRAERWTDSHLMGAVEPLHPSVSEAFSPWTFRELSHFQLLRVLFVTSALWLDQGIPLGTGVAYAQAEGQYVALHMAFSSSIPF